MALTITSGAPTLLIRRTAYEASGVARAAIDERFGLTPDEFRVEGDLVAIGPLYGASESVGELIAVFEATGLSGSGFTLPSPSGDRRAQSAVSMATLV